jgi:hypothetical protein
MTVPEAPAGGPNGAASGPKGAGTAGPRRKRGGRVQHDSAQPRLPVQPPKEAPTERSRLARRAAPVRDKRFSAGAAAYEALLECCPADDRVKADLEALGISRELTDAEGFGAIYPGEHANAAVSRLREALGDAVLLGAPGFVASPTGSARLALPVRPISAADGGVPDAEESPFALIPYRAETHDGTPGPGPILAIEALDLAPGTPAGSVLLGCGTDGRDPRAGGAHHLWAPGGDPRSVNALTDGLLEALRATSAGVRCGAIRTPRSFDPGAGNRCLPELAALDFAGRRVLYAPGPKRSHARTSSEAARATLGRSGASVFVLHKPPYARSEQGFGSFLLSLPAAERSGVFARLFLDPVAHHLAGEAHDRGPSPRAPGGASEGADGGQAVEQPQADAAAGNPERAVPETPTEEDRIRAGLDRLTALRARTLGPFHAQLRSSPAIPERGPKPSRRDRSWGNQVAALVGASTLSACMLALACLSALFAFMARSTAAADALSAEPPAEDPLLLIPWFFATVFREVGTPMGGFADLISPGPLAVLVALVPALVLALPLAITVADVKRRQRIKRVKLHQGRFFE